MCKIKKQKSAPALVILGGNTYAPTLSAPFHVEPYFSDIFSSGRMTQENRRMQCLKSEQIGDTLKPSESIQVEKKDLLKSSHSNKESTTSIIHDTFNLYVISKSGKLVFSRNDTCEHITSLCGIFLMVYESIKSFTANIEERESVDLLQSIVRYIGNKVVYCTMICYNSLLFVISNISGFSDPSLDNEVLLDFYRKIIFLLTNSIHHTLAMLPSFDLRVLLNGVDTHYLKKCVTYRTEHFSFNIQGLHVLHLSPKERYYISCTLKNIKALGPLILGLIAYDLHIVALCVSRFYTEADINSSELSSVLMYLKTSKVALSESEHWIPLCFPSFNQNSFLTLYVKKIQSVRILYISLLETTKQFVSISNYVHTTMIPALEASQSFQAMQKASCLNPLNQIKEIPNLPHFFHLAYCSKVTLLYKKNLINSNSVESVMLPQCIQICELNKTLYENSGAIKTKETLRMKRILYLYTMSQSILKQCHSYTTLPMELYLYGKREKTFCILGRQRSFFCSIPLWENVNAKSLSMLLQFFKKQEPTLFFPLFHLSYYSA